MKRQGKLPEPVRWLFQRSRLFLLGLFCLTLFLGWANVAVQHQVRHLETHYAQALSRQQQLKTEWGKLMLEKSHLTARARVQEIAKNKLHLKSEKSLKLHNVQTVYLSK